MPETGPYLACEVHGRLVRRDQPYSCADPEPVWLCVGFEGEAEGWCTAGPVPADARDRLLARRTRWPGIRIFS
jgi:hypothetical protein